MKKKKILKAFITLLLLLIEFISLCFFTYSLILYKGVETFYRIYGIIILVYFFLFLSYLLLRSIKKKTMKSFIIPAILTVIIIGCEFGGYYYLTKIYKSIDAYSDTTNTYYSSLVTYDTSLNTQKDLRKKKIGIVKDTKDIEGNILPKELIKKYSLDTSNEIKEYDSTIELLHALKNKEIDAAFFSRNYIDMFYSLEGYEDIEKETKVLLEGSKVYESNEEDIKSETASLDKPFTMLFIGVDSSKDGVTSGYNGDVLLLATFNPSTLRATITSIPRDTYIKTACSNGNYRRINTTTWGSSSTCAVKTVESLFDVDIDYYAKINFKGVVSLVDAVGGIDVDVPYSFCEQNSSRQWGDNTVYVKEGKQHLNGEQALALARNRHKPNDGSGTGKAMGRYCSEWNQGKRNDFTRGKNQIKVIMGIASSATKLTDPNQAISILEKIKANFQTNITTKDVLSLYSLAKSIVLNDSANLVNLQRMQLKTYSVWGKVYEPSSKGYPAVEMPYPGSITDIKKEININLGKTTPELVKTASFDLNNLFEDTLIGQDKYTSPSVNTLKNLSSYSVSSIKSYASNNKLKLKFIDYSSNTEVSIDSWENYKFHSQKEHVDTLLDQLSTLTIYVKKQTVTPKPSTPTEPTTPETPTEGTTENTEA